MKHLTVLAVAGLCLLAGCAARTPEQQMRHDDVKYGSELSSYQRDLKPGVSRKEVENYFRDRNIPFSRMCCVTTHHAYGSLDDIVFLRIENHPWPCGTEYVDIGFVFDEQQNQPYTRQSMADPTDTLVGIHVLRTVDCL